jgi:cysteinyl-tRNA synthetase
MITEEIRQEIKKMTTALRVKDYKTSDSIRKSLVEHGVKIMIHKTGLVWKSKGK